MVGSRPSLCNSFRDTFLHPRHRLDHVDGNADRAALIGHGPGNGLANPPRGVGAELEAAAIFELVHRPHQPGVAFLDQVQEAQAAVAVLLGDGNDQPQVPFRKAAFGLLVLCVDLLEGTPPACGGCWAIPGWLAGCFDTRRSRARAACARPAAGALGMVLAHSFAQLVNPAAELLERLDHRLDPLGAQAELLQQPDRPATSPAQPSPRRPPQGRRTRLAGGDVVVAPVPLQQSFQRA